MSATETERRFLSYSEASEYCGVSAQTLRRAVDDGRLRAYRPAGRTVLFAVRDLDRFIRGTVEDVPQIDAARPTNL